MLDGKQDLVHKIIGTTRPKGKMNAKAVIVIPPPSYEVISARPMGSKQTRLGGNSQWSVLIKQRAFYRNGIWATLIRQQVVQRIRFEGQLVAIQSGQIDNCDRLRFTKTGNANQSRPNRVV